MSSIPTSLEGSLPARKSSHKSASSSGENTRRKQQNARWNSGRKPAPKPPLTHFISIPIGHHPAFRAKWTQVSKSLLDASPAIAGLDESVLIKPGGLHITLGVMSLRTNRDDGKGASKRRETADKSTGGPLQSHSVEEALELLKTLREPIRELVREDIDESRVDPILYVPLERLDIMRNGRNHASDDGHVLWAGPDLDGEVGKKFSRVCDLVYSTFKNAGYLQDVKPLKLHCTLINTVYRKRTIRPSFTLADTIGGKPRTDEKGNQQNRKRKERIPFSFSLILSSDAYRLMSIADDGAVTVPSTSGPCKIDLGSWPVDEIQLCKMGSQDADGAYLSVGGISLR